MKVDGYDRRMTRRQGKPSRPQDNCTIFFESATISGNQANYELLNAPYSINYV